MKKFAFAMLAVLVAAVSQAAQVTWTSGDLASLKTADIQSIEGYYYTINEATYSELADASQENLYNAFYKGEAINVGGVEKTYTPIALSGKVEENDRGSINWTDSSATVPAYVVAVYVAKSQYGGSYALASLATDSVTTDSVTGLEDPDTVRNSNIGVSAYYNGGGSWAAVPEPTTVALLALGLAAVGMKRKVA